MLTTYRRHREDCKHKRRKSKGCFCPVWVQGVLNGRPIRKSLDVTSWEAGQRLARDMEIHGEGNSLTVKEACKRWISDCEARNLKAPSIKKYKHVTRELTLSFSSLPVRAVTVDDLRKLRESWKHSSTTARKRLELMRGFFSFCVSSGWVEKNPAKSLKHPQVQSAATLPFSEEEWQRILFALDVFGEVHPYTKDTTRRQLKALVLLMRYSGLRISDACSLRRERIDSDGRLFLYTQKTGKPVHLPLPKIVLQSVEAADQGDPYIFWSGNGKLKTALTDWQERLQQLMTIAGIKGRGVAHRLRDTFSTDLLKHGVPIETVATILGNSVKVVEKHYAPWIESRQVALEAAVKETWR